MNFQDFPAAHSMDSGWFAVDNEGNVAHFETGEAGGMPAHDGIYFSGEMDTKGTSDTMFFEHILPWIARNLDAYTFNACKWFYALFDTLEHAESAAATHGSNPCSANPLMIELASADQETFRGYKGFVGFAPTIDQIRYNERVQSVLPIAWYVHGDWSIPGLYINRGFEVSSFRPSISNIARMDLSFAEMDRIQLADFYSNEECHVWGDRDLRTGEPPPPRPRPEPKPGCAAKIIHFFFKP